MRKTFTFGQLWGIPLKVHVNWFLVAALVAWSLAAGYFPQEQPGWSRGAYWAVASLSMLLFFASVLAHELAHARLALREGVPVNSITLFIFGGVAHIAHEPKTAGSEFRIVIAGPLASLGLGLGFGLLSRLLAFSPYASTAATYLSQVNFILAAFNLLPGFPLDGGRVLRAFFWRWKADFFRATRWAARAGLGMALGFMLVGMALVLAGSIFNGLWVMIVGWYLSSVTWSSYRAALQEEAAHVRERRRLATRLHGPYRPIAIVAGQARAPHRSPFNPQARWSAACGLPMERPASPSAAAGPRRINQLRALLGPRKKPIFDNLNDDYVAAIIRPAVLSPAVHKPSRPIRTGRS